MIFPHCLQTKVVLDYVVDFALASHQNPGTDQEDYDDPGCDQREQTPLPSWNGHVVIHQSGVSFCEGVGLNHYHDDYFECEHDQHEFRSS